VFYIEITFGGGTILFLHNWTLLKKGCFLEITNQLSKEEENSIIQKLHGIRNKLRFCIQSIIRLQPNSSLRLSLYHMSRHKSL